MIVEDQNVSDCFSTYGDRPRQDREDFLRSSRCCIRQPVGSKIHHSFLTPSKIDISENFENLQTAGNPARLRRNRDLTTNQHELLLNRRKQRERRLPVFGRQQILCFLRCLSVCVLSAKQQFSS